MTTPPEDHDKAAADAFAEARCRIPADPIADGNEEDSNVGNLARAYKAAVAEVERLEGIYKSAVEGRRTFRAAYREAEADAKTSRERAERAEAALAEAVAKEREECAKLFEPSCSCPDPCDDYWIWPSPCMKKAATVIRARTRPA